MTHEEATQVVLNAERIRTPNADLITLKCIENNTIHSLTEALIVYLCGQIEEAKTIVSQHAKQD